MSSTTRIPKADIPAEELAGMLFNGEVPEPLAVMWHHRPALTAFSALGAQIGTWDQLDPSLKTFAHMAVAAQIGCSWCLDLNYFLANHEGLDVTKASEVPRWRSSSVFTPLERDVLAYAEAMSETPPQVTDELVTRLLDVLGAAGVVELTAVVGFANLTTRCNTALGVESQEFSKDCPVPLAQPDGYVTSA
ncbi:MAG: carboxymuconolactone decarboxylase [Actinomycetia bacterium]|nr:carboxymuconolactone decarboxylase [Actinomycetes bacterium]